MSRQQEELGTFEVSNDASSVKITPIPTLELKVTDAPFQSFMIDRVLDDMKRKDELAIDAGVKSPKNIINWDCVVSNNYLCSITVNNINSEKRIREIRSYIRWTFERMIESHKRGN